MAYNLTTSLADQKIHIMGSAGSGKTTLAIWLSNALQISAFHLDQIGWNEAGKVSLDKRMSDISEESLQRGQVGTLVEELAPDVYEVEFCDNLGWAYAMPVLRVEQITPATL